MADNIQPGDVVQLKSGGLKMTVEAIDDNGAYCVWFDEKNAVQRQNFAEHLLKKAPDVLPGNLPFILA